METEILVGSGSTMTAGFTASVDSVGEREWDEHLALFRDASIYQTWAYGAVSWGERNLSHLVLKQSGEVAAIAQLRIAQVPLLRRGVAYVRWGPLWRRKNQPADLERLRLVTTCLVQEYVHRRKLLLRLLPNVFREEDYGQVASQIWSSAGLVHSSEHKPYCTIRVNLLRPVPDLRKALDAKWRNKLNGAERNGLTILEGTGDEFYSAFAAVYREMMGRKQFETTVDIEEFARIQLALPDHLKMQIFLCRRDNQVLNALVVTHIGDMPIYLLGATSDEGMKSKGAYLLQWRAMQWLKERGAAWYDLGGINPETNPGVYEFKKGFSGQEAHYFGCFECSGSGVSSALVRAGEYLALRHSNGKAKSAVKTND